MEKLLDAHKYTSYNRKQLEKDHLCGCIFCISVFHPSEITMWCSENEYGEEVTAICPYCGVDSIIGSYSGYQIEEQFLKEMKEYWFAH